jgi:hypothetical protein
MKKQRKNSKSTIRKILSLWPILILFSIFAYTSIANFVVKHFGICKKALITSDLSTWSSRYTNMNYLYEFSYKGKVYCGNSLIHDDPSKVGDSICVVFLEFYPRINRPLSYFKDGDVHCKCK